MSRLFSLYIAGIVALIAGPALAQETEAPDPPAEAGEEDEIGQLRGEIEALRAETDEKITELKEEHEQRIDDIEDEMMSAAALDDTSDRFSVYGFFDLTFNRDFPKKGSILDGLAPETTSFIMSNVNIYFKSQMTESLSALVELRFTFLPHGHESNLETPGISEYERTDMTVNYPNAQKEIRIGGVGIERAHLTWQPRDWFGVIAGYFLTPYGIWNVDHGTPTLITVREPYMQFSQILPLQQLGLQLYGRVYPASSWYFDYAFTVSNGRGPMDAVHDLDENKGLGLRMRLSYEGENGGAALGGYGYWGDYTDLKKVVESLVPEFVVAKEITESYEELAGALDLLVEFYGVRVQAEYIRRLNKYSERPIRPMTSGVVGYQPDYINQSVYGILAWELPLDRWLGDMKLTPYFETDWSQADDTLNDQEAIIMLGGLNFKPSPYVTLKAEAGQVNSIHSKQLDMVFVTGQMAVSF